MRKSPFDKTIRFRLPTLLRAKARGVATRHGLSLSAWLRGLIEQAVAKYDDANPVACATEPNRAQGPKVAALIRSAANGDQASLACLFVDRLDAIMNVERPTRDTLLITMEALTLGRLAASRGDIEVLRQFAAALCRSAEVFRHLGHPDIGARLTVEAMSLLEDMAEDGDELARHCADRLMKDETRQVVQRLGQFRATLQQVEKESAS